MSFTNRNLKFRRCIGCCFLVSMTSALLLSAATAQGTTLTVTNASDSGVGTLRQAILNASSSGGDTINFAAGITTINLLSGELLIDKDLTINGPGPNLLTVQRSAAATFRIFNISSAIITTTISGIKIANGKAPNGQRGGGILNIGVLTIINCTISGNSGPVTGGDGGGISNDGLMTIINSTISGNSAISSGGLGNRGRVTITNSTISANSANNGAGGGIYNSGGTVTITASTISGNSEKGGFGSGGGINNFFDNGTVSARNTIIALNTGGHPDFSGPLTSEGFNLIGNNAGATITPAQSSDQIGVTGAQLNLGPLQDNGGPTFTHALLSGSFAIDKGHSSGLSTDQRGFTRPVGIANVSGGDGSDIGAFEVISGLVANVSTRLQVGQDDDALFEGFIIQGPAGSTKKIIVRGLGPFLAGFGVPDFLANPTLDIFQGNNKIATNNNWRTTQIGGIITADQSNEIATGGFAPSDEAESAIIANLAPGSYTAVVRGLGNTTGIGLVDAFDLSAASPAKVVNFATRGLVQPGQKLLTAGFIIQNGPVRAVIRAIGPSLTGPPFNITNALPDTTLQLRNQNGDLVQENDDWESDQRQELVDTGLQPTNPKEAALVRTIQPGQYTAQVRGKPESTGTGVVEIYFIQ